MIVQENFALALVKIHDKICSVLYIKLKEVTKSCLHHSSGACGQKYLHLEGTFLTIKLLLMCNERNAVMAAYKSWNNSFVECVTGGNKIKFLRTQQMN